MADIGEQLVHDWQAMRSHLPHHHHDQAAAPATAVTPQETPMPVLADAFAAANTLATHINEIAGNPLLAPLADEQLGHYLSPSEIQGVMSLVRTLEAPRKTVVQPQQVQQPDDGRQPSYAPPAQ